jgi:competence protein ComEC
MVVNRSSDIKIIRSLILIGLALPWVFSFAQARPAQNQTTTFINVAEGDSALLSDGNGFYVLIDGGKPEQGQVVDRFLRSQGVSELNVMMASHPDSDHIGGLITILEDSAIQVDQVLYNGYPGTTATWDYFTQGVATRGLALTPVQFPQELTWGSMTAHILNPASGLTNPDSNDASLVVKVDFGATDTLFTGDIDSNIEATVVARGTPVAAQVLKVAHHGSGASSSAPFLAAVHPREAIISVGSNSYGHPSGQTIGRLATEGAQVWRTDRYGNIQVLDTGDAISVNPQFPYIFVYFPFLSKPLLEMTATPLPTLETPTPLGSGTPTPSLTPNSTTVTPPPPDGANVRCLSVDAAQICGWVSDGSPARGATVTVYGRLIVDNSPLTGQTMTATWKFKSTASDCSAITDAGGVGSCSRSIGSATLGYQVNVTISIAGYSVTTWFTPN